MKRNRDHGSYVLKHRVEDWTKLEGRQEYVANGAFIVAAIREGYRAIQDEPGSLNARFNLVWKAKWNRWVGSKGVKKCG